MLTRQDFRFNVCLLRVFSALLILPLDIYGRHGILTKPQSHWKRRWCLAVFGIFILHCAYVLYRLLQVLVYSSEIVRLHLVFHVDVSVWCLGIPSWYIACFIRDPEAFIALFNDGFAGSSGYDHADFPVSPKKKSRQEWLALTMLPLVLFTVFCILVMYAFDQTMAFLLYSSLPEEYKTWSWFVLLFCEEIVFLTCIACNGTTVINAQLIFFERIIGKLQLLSNSATYLCSEEIIEQTYEKLRDVQLKIQIFNDLNRFITQSIKIICLTLATLNGYSVMYERAFLIPEMVALTKSKLLFRARTESRLQEFRRMIQMRVRSVPDIGIQVGRMHTFEKVATIVFVDYVLNNVVGDCTTVCRTDI